MKCYVIIVKCLLIPTCISRLFGSSDIMDVLQLESRKAVCVIIWKVFFLHYVSVTISAGIKEQTL